MLEQKNIKEKKKIITTPKPRNNIFKYNINKIIIDELTNKKVAQKFIYNTKGWKTLRIFKLQNDPLCEECKKNNKIVLAVQVHHIIPFMSVWNGSNISDIKELGFDINNLMSVCDECHKKFHI